MKVILNDRVTKHAGDRSCPIFIEYEKAYTGFLSQGKCNNDRRGVDGQVACYKMGWPT